MHLNNELRTLRSKHKWGAHAHVSSVPVSLYTTLKSIKKDGLQNSLSIWNVQCTSANVVGADQNGCTSPPKYFTSFINPRSKALESTSYSQPSQSIFKNTTV